MTTRSAGRRSNRPRRVARPATGWTQSTLVSAGNITPGVQSGIDLLGGFTVAEKRGVGKILRVIGEIRYRSTAVNQKTGGRFTLQVMQDDAFAVAAWRDPIGDAEDSWYWNAVLLYDEPNLDYKSSLVDTKTTRRLNGSYQTLALVIENSSASIGTIEYQLGFRTLYVKT